jgi:hypothetical protein
MTIQQRITALAQAIAFDIKTIMSKAAYCQNIAVSNLADSTIISHTLGTTKLKISFHDASGAEVQGMGFEILDTEYIKIYTQILDDGPTHFTGEIFLIKRA